MHLKEVRVYSIDYNGPLQCNDTRTVGKLQHRVKELCTGLIRQTSTTGKGSTSPAMNSLSNGNTQESASASAAIDLNRLTTVNHIKSVVIA